MVSRLLTLVTQFTLSVIAAGGYTGVVLLMAVGSACVPLPSEVVMVFAGALAGQGRFNFWLVVLLGALACNLGSWVAYVIGARGGRPLVERYGRYLLMSSRDLEWADRWFRDYGEVTVFFARMLPLIRAFIALPAGVARMGQVRFHVYTFLGSFVWCWALAWLGLEFGAHWEETIRPWVQKFDLLIVAVLLVGGAWFVVSHWKRLRALRSAGN